MSISQKNIYFGVIIGICGFFFGFFSRTFDLQVKEEKTRENGPVYETQKSKEVYNYIEKYYYGFQTKDKKKLEDSYLTSLAMALGDKHTNYFNVKDSEKFVDSLAGDFQGIGAVIQEHRKGIQIMKVIDDSPAKKNNLEAGDVITQVDGISMLGVPVNEAVDKIRGPKGTTVKLSILSLKTDTKKEVSIKRDVVVVPSVEGRMLSGSIGYVEVSVFGETTAQDVATKLQILSHSGAKGFIIDARNNGGGYLDSAVDILSLILPNNVVAVSTRGNDPKDNQTFFTKHLNFSIGDKPLIILINAMSASATEIMAGSLQDHERALIVGEVSYGKGSVQTPFPLSDGSLIKITTAKWYTPKNRGIDEKGITPDIEIHFKDEDYKTIYDRQLEGAEQILKQRLEKDMPYNTWKEEAQKLTF